MNIHKYINIDTEDLPWIYSAQMKLQKLKQLADKDPAGTVICTRDNSHWYRYANKDYIKNTSAIYDFIDEPEKQLTEDEAHAQKMKYAHEVNLSLPKNTQHYFIVKDGKLTSIPRKEYFDICRINNTLRM